MDTSNAFPEDLSISDFGYDLPDEKIARYPLEQRDTSKLLVWKQGEIENGHYADLPKFLPVQSLLVFNDSRVLEARILFQKPSGGLIEIFCLEPHASEINIARAMEQCGRVLWICLIGGASKWKHGQILEKKIGETALRARLVEKRKDDFIVELSWTPVTLPFATVLHQLGSMPLPPYIKRSADITDAERYQTVYARTSGSVAAPTAGLHFSDSLLNKLSKNNIDSLLLTLHVGAGTFMPVKTENISGHHMHEEYIEVDTRSMSDLIEKLKQPVIAVGTTSARTLETLYWLGLKISLDKKITPSQLYLEQYFPYQQHPALSVEEALECLLDWTNKTPEKKLITKTQLFIVPGYTFKIVRGLITNFHQPQSTLLLLVAALIGPSWKSVYRYALENNYRFLSYGDGCLFLPETSFMQQPSLFPGAVKEFPK